MYIYVQILMYSTKQYLFSRFLFPFFPLFFSFSFHSFFYPFYFLFFFSLFFFFSFFPYFLPISFGVPLADPSRPHRVREGSSTCIRFRINAGHANGSTAFLSLLIIF